MIPIPPFSSFSIGPFTIHIYGLLIATAIITAYQITLKIASKNNISSSNIDDYFFYTLPVAIICARLYHVGANWQYYLAHPAQIPAIWNGGLGIFGGIIGGILTIYVLSKKKNHNFFQITDMLAVALPCGQAIGRWGNYFNQELFGYPTTLPWGLSVSQHARPDEFKTNTTFHPTFLYESLLNIVSGVILYYVFTRKSTPSGTITAFYFINYGIIRFIVDFVKIDPDPTSKLGSITLSQGFSLVLILTGILLLVKISSQKARC